MFEEFNKIPRLSRDIVITEKIDGTNAQVYILDRNAALPGELDAIPWIDPGEQTGLAIAAGSRTRWVTPLQDNHGFAKWVQANVQALMGLGPGRHFGEWWGSGIQRGYGLTKGEKRFSLFNTARWSQDDERPACCGVVPVLYEGLFDTGEIERILGVLEGAGSFAAPDFMDPEGIVIFHTASRTLFKKTIKDDEKPKGLKETQ